MQNRRIAILGFFGFLGFAGAAGGTGCAASEEDAAPEVVTAAPERTGSSAAADIITTIWQCSEVCTTSLQGPVQDGGSLTYKRSIAYTSCAGDSATATRDGAGVCRGTASSVTCTSSTTPCTNKSNTGPSDPQLR